MLKVVKPENYILLKYRPDEAIKEDRQGYISGISRKETGTSLSHQEILKRIFLRNIRICAR
jgi:hypothetical protein